MATNYIVHHAFNAEAGSGDDARIVYFTRENQDEVKALPADRLDSLLKLGFIEAVDDGDRKAAAPATPAKGAK